MLGHSYSHTPQSEPDILTVAWSPQIQPGSTSRFALISSLTASAPATPASLGPSVTFLHHLVSIQTSSDQGVLTNPPARNTYLHPPLLSCCVVVMVLGGGGAVGWSEGFKLVQFSKSSLRRRIPNYN